MTRLCRFNGDRLGVIEGDEVIDVTGALDVLPTVRWPAPPGDLLITNLKAVIEASKPLVASGTRHRANESVFKSPVANPTTIIAAPVNYLKHHAEARADGGKHFAADVKTIDEYGLFLKAQSSLVGFGEGIEIAYPNRRTDHEIELVVVIGKTGRNIARSQALSFIAGYCVGLDMTLRGTEDRSLRKSLHSFTVVGPWLVTADEVIDPNCLDLRLEVNGEPRQSSSTSNLIFNVERLVEYASAHLTLHAGDLIFTGTPEGVGPVKAGDIIGCSIESVGSGQVVVRPAAMQH